MEDLSGFCVTICKKRLGRKKRSEWAELLLKSTNIPGVSWKSQDPFNTLIARGCVDEVKCPRSPLLEFVGETDAGLSSRFFCSDPDMFASGLRFEAGSAD
jgi:hypothetical protein